MGERGTWGHKRRKAGLDGFPCVHLEATLGFVLEPGKNREMTLNGEVT